MISWIPAASAPKDGKMILGKFKNYPGRLPAMWNSCDEKWTAATPQCCEMEGESEDRYFENESFDAGDLEVWAEI